MGFFKKELTEQEYTAEMRKLELEIKRAKKKNELLKAKHELEEEKKKYSKAGPFFEKLFKGMGEAGANVKANLDKEAPFNYNNDSITQGMPGVEKGVSFNEDSITKGLPGTAKKPSRS